MFKPSIFDLKAQYLPKLFNCNNNGDFLNANISISLIGFFWQNSISKTQFFQPKKLSNKPE